MQPRRIPARISRSEPLQISGAQLLPLKSSPGHTERAQEGRSSPRRPPAPAPRWISPELTVRPLRDRSEPAAIYGRCKLNFAFLSYKAKLALYQQASPLYYHRTNALAPRVQFGHTEREERRVVYMQKTKGRPKKDVEPAAFAVQLQAFREGSITAKQAADALNISRRSFFRKLKEQPQ